jgi:hypothetical protein
VSAFRQKYNAVRRPVAAQNRSEKLENRLFRNFVVSDPKNATEPSAFKGKHLFILLLTLMFLISERTSRREIEGFAFLKFRPRQRARKKVQIRRI